MCWGASRPQRLVCCAEFAAPSSPSSLEACPFVRRGTAILTHSREPGTTAMHSAGGLVLHGAGGDGHGEGAGQALGQTRGNAVGQA